MIIPLSRLKEINEHPTRAGISEIRVMAAQCAEMHPENFMSHADHGDEISAIEKEQSENPLHL